MNGTEAISDLVVSSEDKLAPKDMREGMLNLEIEISKLPGVKFGDDCAPLKHTFGDNLYIREITMPKGWLIVSKLHKTTHPYFVLKGDVSVLTERGMVRIKAPYSGITKAGTKRVLYMHEDTVWTTVHSTKETNLEKIEEEIIAKSYNDLPENVKKEIGIIDEVKLLEFKEYILKDKEN